MTLVEYAEWLGLELTPYQRHYFEAIDQLHTPSVWVRTKRAGQQFFDRIIQR